MLKQIAPPFSKLYALLLLCLLCIGLVSCSSSKKSSTRYKAPSKRHASAPESREPKVVESLEEKVVESPQQKVVFTARSYMGTPYKWGGTTRAGMDCSGLLVSSFRAAEINLPRTSGEQSKFGKRVSLYELQPGDLLFFAAKQGRGKITHVGMVTEVRGRDEVMFIHASSSLGVVEANLHSDYYRKIFIKAQRPF